MHSAALRSAQPLQRPTKRRRTATTVLAGDFEPRPLRNCFTNMADAHNRPCSDLTHGTPVLADRRDNRPTLAPSARSSYERDPLLVAKLLAGGSFSTEYARRRPNSPSLPQNWPVPPSPSSPLLLPQSPSGTSPPRLHYPAHESPRQPAAPLSSARHAPWLTDYRAPFLQWNQTPPPLQISTAPPPPAALANSPRSSLLSTSPRSSLHPNSPPTPSRSISSYTSYTSRTSSKRPRTPDDDEELIPGPSPRPSDAFSIYDAPRAVYSPASVLASPFQGPRDAENRSSPPKSLAWYSPPANAMQAELPSQPGDTSPFSLDRSPPAHRRHALSVAALLSPSVRARTPPPAEPSAPAESPSPLLATAVLSYPSPSEGSMDMDVCEDVCEDAPAGPGSEQPVEDPAETETEPAPAPARLTLSPADFSPEPERDIPDAAKVRASKAMRTIESEEELTDLENAAATATALSPAPLTPGRVRRRKRPAARKGWKGWVEVEVDEDEKGKGKEERVPRVASAGEVLPWASLRERRTRSGRQFDA